ncbi:cyclin-T1-3-like isoform X2 [Impatiens glandulifera]|uniref:cyclin-T1-3-like isoform X2 n=1 Tax=Impatiens glandulifera TaxID=253017 RepID=UPI001FB126F3|nr:cyclin-T1-3-like isoform X2 [Impatiens glandulifera]
MASGFPVDSSYYSMHDAGSQTTQDNMSNEGGGGWYYSRKEIEENSPSRKDGIDLKKETYLRKSYCTFLQDLGMRLKVPQVTIATAILFCHRFFLRQSHAKNDRRTIATVCMFLAGKVEESPRPLKDVILVSYEIIHKRDPNAVQRIKQKGERSVLATLAFDFNVNHPYKPLVEAIKKFKVAQNALAQVAWNFVNDGLRTSLCLQLKPHHIAAGAIFLAAKFLKVKLPSDGDKVWWQEFDVTPRQLEEVSNQMLELYEQNTMLPTQASEAEDHRAKPPSSTEDHPLLTHSTGTPSKSGSIKPSTSLTTPSHLVGEDGEVETSQNRENDQKVYVDDEVANEYEQQPHRAVEEDDEGRNVIGRSEVVGGSPHDQDAMKRIDKKKVKAALEKQRRSRGDGGRKTDLMGDDDLIEWELKDDIELAGGEKSKQQEEEERRQSSLRSDDWSNEDDRRNIENVEEGEFGDESEKSWNPKSNGESSLDRRYPEEEEEEVWNGNKQQQQNHRHNNNNIGQQQQQDEKKRKNKSSSNSERSEKKRRHMEYNNNYHT